MDVAALESALKENNGFGVLTTIHAWICYYLKIPCEDAIQGYLYSSIVMTVNCALRLMSLGQTEGQILINRLLPVLKEQWRAVSELPTERIHSFALAQEIHAMKHETLYSRLFMS